MIRFHAMEKLSARFPHCGKKFSTPWKNSSRPFHFFILNFSFFILAAQAAHAQLGPFPIVTRQATFNAEIVKRDQDTLWVRRQTSDGRPSPQVGISIADIVGIRVPRPSIFDAAERVRTTPGATDDQFQAAHRALDRFILQTKSLRAIPGIPADEAILLKGRLYHQKGLWREALRQYEDIVANGKPSAIATSAQILAGVVYSKTGEHQFAVEYLGGMPLPEEDEELLSELLFALGNSYFALENYDNALLSYLPLVVFYPYVHNNEPRGLAAALGCYAQLKEWEPLYRTIQEIQKNYPGTPAAKTADEFIVQYKDDLVRAGQFVDGDPIAPNTPAAPAATPPAAPPM